MAAIATSNPRPTAAEREAAHEEKIISVVRSRIKEARRTKITGKLVIEIALMKGGPSTFYTEIDAKYRILEEVQPTAS